MKEILPWVCIPGFMLDETLWNDMKANLAESQPVLCASLANGDSIATMAENIAVSAPERFVLIGFSLGGYVARTLAAQYPQRVAALVLIATSLREDTPQQYAAKQNTLQIQQHLNFRGLGHKAIIQTLRPDNQNNQEMISRIRQMSERLGFDVLSRQSLLNRKTPTGQKISCPTLIIAAAQDQMRSIDEAKELQEFIPQASLKIIENSGHMLPLEQPEILAEMISGWLNQL
ncbi:putative hydrolases or acyltransferase (alpha/beta hydrolase superfamily) [Snodgrassella alvi SCGC AB-598-J21]|uniref:Putative hydrolases or acyltransferase (Alpha/beta hydrolase superfamily) n=1 Tax=Snodgrassella alvi SCGC AB-598-J21 TaxID=1385367 RepID=A0A074VBC5_9NEIS|nr:putative hydrolases or acyltransferase (alpha/beta hydrolase superfamily) [Snodgrassella alvi SCGC AB-598-J21]